VTRLSSDERASFYTAENCAGMLAVIDTVLLQREIIEVHLASLYSLLSMGY